MTTPQAGETTTEWEVCVCGGTVVERSGVIYDVLVDGPGFEGDPGLIDDVHTCYGEFS